MKTINDYADLVKEQHALNTTIAPVETDLTSASKAYAVGQKFIYDGVLYQAKTAIAQGAALVLNTNYEAADDVSSEIQTLTNNLEDEIETRAKLCVHNIMPYPYYTSTPTTLATSLAVSEPERAVIRFNGTSVGAAVFYCGTDVKLPVGEYEISKGVNNDNVCALVEAYNGSTWVGVLVPEDYTAASSTFTLDYSNYDNLRITVRVKSGATLSNVDVKPMIKLTSDKDNTWQSPAMTNRELTEKVDGVDYEMQYNGAYFHVIKYGDYYHCYSNSNFTSTPSIDDWTTIGSVPNSTNRDFCGILLMNSGVIIKVRVKADGNVQIYKVSGTFGSNLYIQCSCVLA